MARLASAARVSVSSCPDVPLMVAEALAGWFIAVLLGIS